MSPWSVLIGSLLRERPPKSSLLTGGRGVVSPITMVAARIAHDERKARTRRRVLACFDKGREWTTVELAKELGLHRDYVTRTCHELMKAGKIDGRQEIAGRKTWFWRRIKK